MLTFAYWIGNRRYVHQTSDPRAALAFVQWCTANGFPVRPAADIPAGRPLRIPA